MKCFKCGAEDNKKLLFDAIISEGIVKVCESCAQQDRLPIIKKPTNTQLNELDRKPSVYERLSKAAGVNPYARRNEKSESLIKQETSLREVVERNYKDKVKEKIMPREDLIDNFHWKLMVARRMKKLTQKQVAEAIGEVELAVKMAEQGVLPSDNKIIRKFESFYGIKISKENNSEFFSSTEENLDFDRKTPSNFRIGDLKQKAQGISSLDNSGENDLILEETEYNIDSKDIQQNKDGEAEVKPKRRWFPW